MKDPDTEHPAERAAEPHAEADTAGFVGRWSRRKRAVARGETPPEPAARIEAERPSAEPSPLPDPATLTMDDDFSSFLRQDVAPALKRKAMQHLFSQAHFNTIDGLDVYLDDYNQVPNLDSAAAALVRHAKAVLDPQPRGTPPGEDVVADAAPDAQTLDARPSPTDVADGHADADPAAPSDESAAPDSADGPERA